MSDAGWALVAPHLALPPEDAGQRRQELRDVFDGLRYVVNAGAPWRWMPHDLPPSPWPAVCRQARRRLTADGWVL